MTPEQCDLVLSYMLERISYAEFVARSGMDPRGTPGFGVPLLREALASADSLVVECAILLNSLFEAWSGEHVPTLIELLAAPWHMKHEDVASILQGIRDPRSVEALYRAALVKLSYLAYDDSQALARKCTWALADIGTPEARARLEALTTQEDEEVADCARRRLTRWDEELGRKGPHPTGSRR
jgi:hypothetical protein